ncbi:MAG TPA: hypothetical protein VHM64_18425, partial [Candidatus Binatia bacterium]|nr:hypothetical protein [Candidatus Binatia bacterium]
MKWAIALMLFVAGHICGFAINGEGAQMGAGKWQWDFHNNPVDQVPAGFSFGRTGSAGSVGWLVKTDKDAPSGTN